jgi:molybdate transport system regulatory protein
MPSAVVARSTVWLEREGTYLLGQREAQLLEAVERVGSIKEAAKAVALSYRTAWARIQTLEHALGQPMVRSRAGGPGGGATTLTPEGKELVRSLLELSKHVEGTIEREYHSTLPPQV